MIVVDASAVLELLLATETGLAVADRLRTGEAMGAPQLLLVECLQVLRRSEHRREIEPGVATELVGDLLALDIDLYDHALLAPRIWQLRENCTAYDAAYVALSELLDANLVTTDAKLAATPGHRVRVELIEAGRGR